MKINATIEVPDGPICWRNPKIVGWAAVPTLQHCQFLNRFRNPAECRIWDEKIKGGPVRGYKKCQQCLDAKVVTE